MADSSRTEVLAAARQLIATCIELLCQQFGGIPKRQQTSVIMTATTPSGYGGGDQTRSVPDYQRALEHVQRHIDQHPETSDALQTLIEQTGVEATNHMYGYLLPLLRRWIRLPAPLDSNSLELNGLLDEFGRAVVDRKTSTTCIDLIVNPRTSVMESPLRLSPEAVLRPITDEEIWEYGEVGSIYPRPFQNHFSGPSPSWAVLEIEVAHDAWGEPERLAMLKRSVIAALVLAYQSPFYVFPVDYNELFGRPGGRGGRPANEAWTIRGGFNLSDHALVLDSKNRDAVFEAFTLAWQAFSARSSYLRLPLERLMDSVSRERGDDSVIDSVIGLESLLVPDARGETTFRFALTGAQILGSTLLERKIWRKKLKKIYELRSSLVHGRARDAQGLLESRREAVAALRSCWLAFAKADTESSATMRDSMERTWLC